MLDKRCLALLDIINTECKDSGYKVFSLEETALLMPPQFNMDVFGVDECISVLSQREYVSVKYHDQTEVCLCPLTKGRLVFENKIEEQKERAQNQKRYFLYSFLGGILGGVVSGVLSLIVLLLSRGAA